MSSSVLDQWLQRLQNMDSFNIEAIVDEGQDAEPWYEVQAVDVVKELVINEFQLRGQVEGVTDPDVVEVRGQGQARVGAS